MTAIEILHDRLPTVAIVGRPNVGKSTLFNRMVGRRKAVVLDEPGMTRDRNLEMTEWCGRPFAIVDTGGYETDAGSDMVKQMRAQSMIAMREADVIIFLTNVRDQIHPDDEDVANLLRRTRKPVLIAVNKCDNPRFCQEAMTFYALGFEDLFTISALNGDGTGDLLDRVLEVLPPPDDSIAPEKGIRIAVIGKPNAGKSSLINAILGEDRVIVSDVAGTTRDAIDTTFRIRPPKAGETVEEEDLDEEDDSEIIHSQLDDVAEEAIDDEQGWHDDEEDEEGEEEDDASDADGYGEYVFQSEIDEVEENVSAAVQKARDDSAQSERPNTGIYTIVDTAGLRRRGKIQRGIEKLSAFSAQASLRRSDVALVMIDAAQGLTEQDAHVAGFAHDEKRACILLVNKWDLLTKDNATHGTFIKHLRHEMGFLNYAPILMISAKTQQRVHQVLPMVDHVYAEFNKWIDTPTLNKWLEETLHMQSPPWRKGHQLRIKYITQVAVRPPTFMFFVNSPRLVHFSYQRYLQNRLRQAFGFEGCPLRIKFRAKTKRVDDEMRAEGIDEAPFDEFFAVVKMFESRQIDYAVIGGLALSFYALPRFTRDMDFLVLEAQTDQVREALEALAYFASSPPMSFEKARFVLHRFMKTEGEDFLIVDILIGTEKRHTEIVNNAVSQGWEQGQVKVATREDIIWLKSQRNSDQDQVDIRGLQNDTH